ncbi:MAG: heparinase II/III family protein [Chloroflexi bacterium]|nr:heparinase II/III family protein [Chloroflexota bacterium]
MSFHLSPALKALRQLGLQPVGLYALYRLGLATGHYRRVTSRQSLVAGGQLKAVLPVPGRDELLTVLGKEGKAALLAEADEIVRGKVRLFGAEPVDLQLTLPGKLAHWTAYETGKTPFPNSQPATHNFQPSAYDIKLLWEPSRFGWAFTLGRAYQISKDEQYAEAFWRFFETFADANPPYLGPNWMSGQEVALRLMAFVWAAQVFANSFHSMPERLARLSQSVAQHATRIPPTLVYARSQNNNHLLTEAAGLLTAGLALAQHPQSARWRALGWKWLNRGFQAQIDGYGEYSQHSTNYHRLMLQVALWARALTTTPTKRGQADTKLYKGFPRKTLDRLTAATHWLYALLDPVSGRVPNLGANDGAYIFPLTICPFADYRPVMQTAAQAFLDYQLPRGAWDEMSLWFGIPLEDKKYVPTQRYLGDHLYAKNSWAYLRTAQFTSRPSHADQLHLDLWWRGLNVAQDAGTYLYNAPPPWDNSLTTARVHNTVTVNGRDQMTRAGRFLYLDWFDVYRQNIIESNPAILQCVIGRYRKSSLRHTRTVTVYAGERWSVEDEMLMMRGPFSSFRLCSMQAFRLQPSSFTLHWLLPDWEWKVENRDSRVEISLKSPLGVIVLALQTDPPLSTLHSLISLARCGELIYGEGPVLPISGWVSPTYGVRIPALSFALEATSAETVKFTSEFTFPTDH